MKKLFTLVVFVALCTGARASYLYWQVDSTDYSGITAASEVNAFGLYAVQNKEGGTKTLISDYTGSAGQKIGPVDVTAYSENYSFVIELYKYADSSYAQLGQGDYKTYAELSSAGYILDEPLSITQAQAWHGGTMTVPEPTSGFLVMVGLALLGLKRRKV